MTMAKRFAKIFASIILVVFTLYGVAWALAAPTIGEAASGARRLRMDLSPQFNGKNFFNLLPRKDGPVLDTLRAWFFEGSPDAVPKEAIPVVPRVKKDFETRPASGLRVTWLGHSTLLVELDGARVLIDPVWGPRASPFTFSGPKRWFESPLPLDELPDVDVIVISHDHYDHLDTPTVKRLLQRNVKWGVPLGIGAHLESWGVRPQDIIELDWWQDATVGPLKITSVPARHFSGRWLGSTDQTLWTGWVLTGAQHKVYYSGDTAMFPGFEEIGRRLGPFDLTMIEVGAYNRRWGDVHMGPEQAVRAHRIVGGNVFLPVHWGLFDLALHAWTEPMERVLVASEKEHVRVMSPKPGESMEPASTPDVPTRWWPNVAWKTVEEEPAWSSGVEDLMERTAP